MPAPSHDRICHLPPVLGEHHLLVIQRLRYLDSVDPNSSIFGQSTLILELATVRHVASLVPGFDADSTACAVYVALDYGFSA